jgi:tetratricopeptide (TPR) repeat protein
MRLLQPVSGSEEDGTLVVRAHRLVQEYVNSCMESEELTFRQQALFGFLKSKDDTLLEDPNWVDTAWEAEPLTQLAYTWSEADRPLPSFIYDFAASRWHGMADWHRAEPLMRRALAFEEEANPPRPVILISRLNSLAVLLKESGRYEEARALYERTLGLHATLPEVNDRYICIAKRNLAMLLITMPTRTADDVNEALRLCNEAKDLAENSVGPMDTLFAISLFDLGRALMADQRPADAEPVFRQALKINSALLAEGHPEISRIQNALSTALSDQGKHSEVRQLLDQAFTSDEESFGSNHPIMANRWYHKGLAEFDAGDFVKAEEFLHKSLHMLLVQTFRTNLEAPGKDLVSQRYMATLRQLNFGTEQCLQKLRELYSEARNEAEGS